MIAVRLLTGLLFLLDLSTAFAQSPAFLMNERLGRGINIGNTFEAPEETAWGNPWHASYFRTIASLGFDHVRVPIRWETAARSMDTAPYSINPDFLKRIREVVDSALRYRLHVIINMHHHDALFEDPTREKERFLSQWNQIAEYFQDYPDSLLFEVLNEPHANLTPDLWNPYFADALAEIRQTNPTRVVLMGVADYGGPAGVPKLELPEDDRIILTVHYYNPFPFTHQGAGWVNGADTWLGTEWQDTEADRQAVATDFAQVLEFSEEHHVPVHIGEFGAYHKADMASRTRWTTFLARWFEQHNMSWAYWEYSAGFGIYDPATKQLAQPLVDALLHRDMPEPTPVNSTVVYASDFSGGTDGWSLLGHHGAGGQLTTSDNQLVISIANGGTEGWHLQLVRDNLMFEEDAWYRISFHAGGDDNANLTWYAGQAADPWTAYSGYHSIAVTAEQTVYSTTFTMSFATDPAGRLVFDLGKNTGTVRMTNIQIEKLTLHITALEEERPFSRPLVYPNPTVLWVAAGQEYEHALLSDLQGRTVAHCRLSGAPVMMDLTSLPPGLYILGIFAEEKHHRTKIIKQ